jgi:TPR repeat protein
MRQSVAGNFLAVSVSAALMLGATLARGGELEDATAAYGRGEYAAALRQLRPLAESGNATAQNNLGVIYFKGEGVAKDLKEAEKWYRMAAEQGHPAAQSGLGLIKLMSKDYKEAAKWIQLSADQGYPPSQLNLAIMYYQGDGVPRDPVRAHMWMSLAALQGDPNARNYRDEMAKSLTPAQVEQSLKLVKEWKPK